MADKELDIVGETKKKLLDKLKESGAPEAAIEAVDFLSPDDLTDLGMGIAASFIPYGRVIQGVSKIAPKAVKAIQKTAPKAKPNPVSYGPGRPGKETMADVRRLKKQGEGASDATELVLGAGLMATPAVKIHNDKAEREKTFNKLVEEKKQRDKKKKKKEPEAQSQVMGVRG